MKLDDKNIRSALLNRLKTYKNCYIFEEVTIPSGKARADVVAINGHVIAYEIKSDYDSLQRLHSQIYEYDLNFEKNYIVTGKKFSSEIVDIVPEYWGVILVEMQNTKKMKLKFIRRAKLNPKLSFNEFIGLLSSEEIKKIAKSDSTFTKKHKKNDIQKMFKQEIINKMDEYFSMTKKLKTKKIIRNNLINKSIEV